MFCSKYGVKYLSMLFMHNAARLVFLFAMFVGFIETSVAEKSVDEKLRDGVMLRDMEMLRSALQAGADPNYNPKGKPGPLWLAVNNQNPVILELLLKNGGDPNLVDIYGSPIIHEAARVINTTRDHSAENLELLVRFGADIEAQDEKKRYRTLNSATVFGTYSTIKTLLDLGANPNNTPINGFPALFGLSNNRHCKLDCLELLLRRGANPDLISKISKRSYRESINSNKDINKEKIELVEKYYPEKQN